MSHGKEILYNNLRAGNHPARIAIVDSEIGIKDKKVHDIGAWRYDDAAFHSNSKKDLIKFLENVDYVCGHNIVNHDALYLFDQSNVNRWHLVDTLYLSPLLFPERPYHRLVKDDKLDSDDVNNPYNDCLKAKELLYDEIHAWHSLPVLKQDIFTALLKDVAEFKGFLQLVDASVPIDDTALTIREYFADKLCVNVDIDWMIKSHPCELAYALALIDTSDYRSVTPGWVLRNFPNVEYVVGLLRQNRCSVGCAYCNSQLDIHRNLYKFFGYSEFRRYEGEPLQQKAVQAAVDGRSLLAIFPTGGGKSLTFQLPALMSGVSTHGLTVVISPLQSLMKDQVDNLIDKGITDAVTVNGLLDPITRALSIQRVIDGEASILYISPEMLRSSTIERILLARNVVRFVIDEAHCFSAWGQDFRVDYLYIGKFIRQYIDKKGLPKSIPVSCFTATAKPKVIQDICDYFRDTVGLALDLFASNATRTNLQYSVIYSDSDEGKYSTLRHLIAEMACPTIVYVSRTKRTVDLAAKLSRDGFSALPYNGKMEADEKIANQDAFMRGDVDIIVATSAFGMGVDKSDVGLVIHYDISDSLENYVQEAGRAGRDPRLTARCYVLYNDKDLDKHFILLNQTKLSINEIQQVWRAIKTLTRNRERVNCSALEIARQAGWDDSVSDIETRVRTALSALEQGGYIERGNNMPHVFATGITVKNMDEAKARITASALFSEDEINNAVRIIKSLISQKYINAAMDALAESRIDYLADILGLTKSEVISAVSRMRQEGILADSRDITAYLLDVGDTSRKSHARLEYFAKLESFIFGQIPDTGLSISYKQLNDSAINDGIGASKEKDIRSILYFLTIKGYIRKKEFGGNITVQRLSDIDSILKRHEMRVMVSRLAIDWLYEQASALGLLRPLNDASGRQKMRPLQFSVIEMLEWIKSRSSLLIEDSERLQIGDIEESLLYLSKIGALKLEGGFLVVYNAMHITRTKEPKVRYKQSDYRMLDEFYKQKIQQIHIVGEYANLMVRDYQKALQFVNDYFHLHYKKFISKYFEDNRLEEIQRNITPHKYNQMFGELSDCQRDIITDKQSRCIVVAAGPGSGKTRVLAHKLASLVSIEDVKHEQLLMLTFSRSAATEFKERLIGLIGNAAHFVEIKTFHSYCFDLLGRIGNLEDAKNVVARAAEMIETGEVEPNRICKTVLVIDEAQDIGKDEYRLVKALMTRNDEMRVIAVGDDDQSIYEFRGADSGYMYSLTKEFGSRLVEMTENFRSKRRLISFANEFVKYISQRIKTQPIIAVSREDGWVEVTRHRSDCMYTPLVEDIIRHSNGGSVAVLTQTNEEAVIIVGQLRKLGIRSSLIQSMGSFKFWNLAEMRYFMKYIDKRISSPIIPDDVWTQAKNATQSVYRRSRNIEYVMRCAQLFEQTCRKKYVSDFKDYVFESKVEDFSMTENDEVVVSTIHKAKGREYDDVYMLVTDRGGSKSWDSQMRTLYVGLTRAKSRLFIHTDSVRFDKLPASKHNIDDAEYAMPKEVVLQLSHKDVFLDFFKDKKSEVLALQAGDMLFYNDYVLYTATGMSVVKLSLSMQHTIDEWHSRGYEVVSAAVRFVVAWRPKDAQKTEQETAVLLADLTLAAKEN